MNIKPNLNTFCQKYKSTKFNRFCLSIEVSADLETPITAYLKLIKEKTKNSFILESVEGGSRRGRYSIIGIEIDKLLKDFDSKKLVIERQEIVKKIEECESEAFKEINKEKI